MLEHAAPRGGPLNLEQLSAALSAAAKDLQVSTTEDVEALNNILGQVRHPSESSLAHLLDLFQAGYAGPAMGATWCMCGCAQCCPLRRLHCWVDAVQAVKLGDVGIVQQLLALVPRDIGGGVGKVQASLSGSPCIHMSALWHACLCTSHGIVAARGGRLLSIATGIKCMLLLSCATCRRVIGQAARFNLSKAYLAHVQVLAASSYAALLAQAWDALPADAQHAGDAEAASTLLHAAQDLCAYQAAVGEHYCCPIALPFSMLPCLLATQSGVCDPAAVVIHSSTLCKVCMPSAGSGKKMTWKSVGREACGPHWMGRLVAYLTTARCALLCPDAASIAEVQHMCVCMLALCPQ